VAAYARVSSDKQEKEQTIDSQVDALRRPELTKRPFGTHKRTKLEHGCWKFRRTGHFGPFWRLVVRRPGAGKQVMLLKNPE